MCAQLVVYPQRRPIFSTTLLGWLPVPYYTQHDTILCGYDTWVIVRPLYNFAFYSYMARLLIILDLRPTYP